MNSINDIHRTGKLMIQLSRLVETVIEIDKEKIFINYN